MCCCHPHPLLFLTLGERDLICWIRPCTLARRGLSPALPPAALVEAVMGTTWRADGPAPPGEAAGQGGCRSPGDVGAVFPQASSSMPGSAFVVTELIKANGPTGPITLRRGRGTLSVTLRQWANASSTYVRHMDFNCTSHTPRFVMLDHEQTQNMDSKQHLPHPRGCIRSWFCNQFRSVSQQTVVRRAAAPAVRPLPPSSGRPKRPS